MRRVHYGLVSCTAQAISVSLVGVLIAHADDGNPSQEALAAIDHAEPSLASNAL